MSTRLILKNLPKNADEARVRELFKAKGDVTDVKVLRTKDGRSRCFGFVGFKDKQHAADAQKYFDKACMGSCRLQVSFAEPYKGENTATEAAGGDDGSKPEPGNVMDSSAASIKASKREQLLQEFLGVNKHKSKHQMHANDEVNPALDPARAQGDDAGAAEDEGSDVTKHDLDEKDDMEYLRSRMGKLDSGAEVRNSEQDMPEAVLVDDRRVETAYKASALIRETSKLFVRNLPFVTTDDDLLALMEKYGNLQDVKIVRDKSTGASRGYAVVQFRNADSAVEAFQDLDGKPFQGRLLHIIPGKKTESALPEGTEAEAPKQGGYKAERDSKRKASAGDKQVWSTFFMREDTVAQAVADLLGITKAELLDPEAPDAAVRLALGETQVIDSTKKELAEAGVSVAALESAARASGHAAANSSVKRSTMVLLVKNLPSEATEDALEDLFAKHGTVVRVILPRTKALAVVEMSDEQCARRAFKQLAYKRFLHVPLYLEYAPEDVLDESVAQATGRQAGERHKAPSGPLRDADLVEANEEPAVDVDAPDSTPAMPTTLYIKNISFETAQVAFEKHCKKVASAVGGVLRAVAVPSKKTMSSGKQSSEKLLQGFAFAEFGDQRTAEAALKRLQGTTLDGHKLQVEFSRQEPGGGKKSAAKRERDSSETKLMVRNLAFEATSKDVRRLMEAFGHVKTCRLPKKFDGTTRGFAFVEFATKGEAQRAMESAYGTHLYGRRLLLEYAKGEEGVGELRSKAQRVG